MALEHSQILIPMVGPGTNAQRITRDANTRIFDCAGTGIPNPMLFKGQVCITWKSRPTKGILKTMEMITTCENI